MYIMRDPLDYPHTKFLACKCLHKLCCKSDRFVSQKKFEPDSLKTYLSKQFFSDFLTFEIGRLSFIFIMLLILEYQKLIKSNHFTIWRFWTILFLKSFSIDDSQHTNRWNYVFLIIFIIATVIEYVYICFFIIFIFRFNCVSLIRFLFYF
jgi:hypothetical protein